MCSSASPSPVTPVDTCVGGFLDVHLLGNGQPFRELPFEERRGQVLKSDKGRGGSR